METDPSASESIVVTDSLPVETESLPVDSAVTTSYSSFKTHISFARNSLEVPVDESKQPVHPQYVSYHERYRSFEDWPVRSPAKPELLAESGFFYKGYFHGFLDHVACYQCGMGMVNWRYGDHPHVEHRRMSPNCVIMRQTKEQRDE